MSVLVGNTYAKGNANSVLPSQMVPIGSLPAVPSGPLPGPGDSIGVGEIPTGVVPAVSTPLSAVDKTVELTLLPIEMSYLTPPGTPSPIWLTWLAK